MGDAQAEASLDDGQAEASSFDATTAVGGDSGEAGASSSGSSGSSSGGSSSASGCHYAVVVPGSCGSTILAQGGVSSDAGTTSGTSEPVFDDAGDLIDSGTTTFTVGGISTIPAAYLVGGANGTSVVTVSAESVGSYTVTGLTNGSNHNYNFVVAAVDGSGNIGPPSTEVCDYPALVDDFYKDYRRAGGTAGGGFCSVERLGASQGVPILGFGFAALAFGLVRRRQKRSRDTSQP